MIFNMTITFFRTTKTVKDTNQNLIEEPKATIKAPDDITKKFPTITPQSEEQRKH